MRLFPDEPETIEGTARAIRDGRRTCVDVVEACLARIDKHELNVRAWVVVDREGALGQARRLDEELTAGRDRGPLHGIPIGIKDIVDMKGFPTAAGFGPWSDRAASRDAEVVKRLREAGAVILGKTVTTQFAWIDPPVTRNPWNLERTPGGSSSGSAAAVATGMCLGAIGTQTGGSITRPAAFCGVCGFKPAWGGISREGIFPFAPSLDHPGPLARTIGDLQLLARACADQAYRAQTDRTPLLVTRPTPIHQKESPDQVSGNFRPPVLVRVRGPLETFADATMNAALENAVDVLRNAGALVSDRELLIDEVHKTHRAIMATEAAETHRGLYEFHRDDYRSQIGALIEEGTKIPPVDYSRAVLRKTWWTNVLISKFFDRAEPENNVVQALLLPATVGPAPDRSTTGDPVFNSPWSLAGLPTLSIPIGLSPDGLPLACQLVGGPDPSYEDLFRAALWCEAVLRRDFESRSP